MKNSISTQCLESILEANYDKDNMEVFVVDGMSQG